MYEVLPADLQLCQCRWMMTSTALHNKSGDREMLFSPDLPDELLDRFVVEIS